MNSYDVIVLGLGAMGSAASYQLAKSGAKVLGIDQFSPPHTNGSSHGDTRITRQAIGEGTEYVPLVLRSYDIWKEIEKETGKKLLEITGGLIISSGGEIAKNHVEDFFENTVEAAEKYQIEHELLSVEQIRKRFPQFNVADNEKGYFEKNAGFLRPEECISVQLELAKKYGGEIHTNEKVVRFEDKGNEVFVKTEKGEYTAKKLIMSVGSWLPELLDDSLKKHFKIHRQVLYWFDAKDSIEPFLLGNFPVFIWELQGNLQGIYGFPALEKNGGVKIATEQYVTTTTPETVDRIVTAEETTNMFEKFVGPYFPGLSEKCIKAVTCLYTDTPDAGFVIDTHPNYKNIIIASPCSGHGFKHSAAIGEVLAQLASKGKSNIDISPFSLIRF